MARNKTMTNPNRDYGSMVLITYTLRPGSEADGYDDWLRKIDNPTFNKTPGIAHYANWKVKEARGAELPYTHFDLLGIDGPESLEQVWFDEPLDEFRKGWVEKWGSYSAANPAKANTIGGLSERIRAASGPRTSYVIFVGGSADAVNEDAGYDTWRIDELVRKHWSVGRAKPGGALANAVHARKQHWVHPLPFEVCRRSRGTPPCVRISDGRASGRISWRAHRVT